MIQYQSQRTVRKNRVFPLLVICLLFAATNLGLVNRFLGIRASDGGNILGVRDILVGLILFVGLLRMLHVNKNTVLTNKLSKITLFIVFLTPIATAVGLFFDGSPLLVVRDMVMMFGWLLALVIASNLRDRDSITSSINAVIIIGVLVAIGVFIETWTFGRVLVVTPLTEIGYSGRSTPSGFPVMMVSSSLLFVYYLLDQSTSRGKNLLRLFGWMIILVASLLTQSRTLLVAIVVSTLILLVLSALFSVQKINWKKTVPLFIFFPVGFLMASTLGNRFIRSDFSDYFSSRYEVLTGVETLVDYSNKDTRRAEIELGMKRFIETPIVGVGLGSKYRAATLSVYNKADPAITIHNAFAFFLFRYGIAGLIAFLLLIFYVFQSLYFAFRSDSIFSLERIGLCIGLVNLFACAVFGNVFGTTYGVPQSMIILGLLIACEEFGAEEESRTKRGEMGIENNYRSKRIRKNW